MIKSDYTETMDKVKEFPNKLIDLSSSTWLTNAEFQSRKRLREETAMDVVTNEEDQQQNVRRVKIDTAHPSHCGELWSARNDSSTIDNTHNASSTSNASSEFSSFNSEPKGNTYLDTTLSMSDFSWTDYETESVSSSRSECTHTKEDVNDIEHNFAAIALECVRKNREQKKAEDQIKKNQ